MDKVEIIFSDGAKMTAHFTTEHPLTSLPVLLAEDGVVYGPEDLKCCRLRVPVMTDELSDILSEFPWSTVFVDRQE